MKFLSRYSNSRDIGKKFLKPSLTDQQFKQECDVGYIVENYARLGKPFDQTGASYIDCTTVQDYQEAMYTVAHAKSNFESLPSKERDRFKTVENYLEFISDNANLKESYEKGYIDRNSVDISDVYPEKFKIVQNENISQTPPVQLSEQTFPDTPSTSKEELG